MRKLFLCLTVLAFYFSPQPVMATSIPAYPAGTVLPGLSVKKITELKSKELRQLLGRKLTLKEKISFLFLKKQLKKKAAERKDPGEGTFVAGLIGGGLFLAGLLFPPLLIGSLIAAIIAVGSAGPVLRKDPGNKKAKTGQILGWITIGLFLALLALAVAILSTLSWGWG